MEEELLSGPVAPQATSEKMLQILSGLAPRDPAAANPATTAAMARSRDAITRTLERQMARQEEPFSGINDVATAAITALASRHKTPFGAALAKLDADRDNSTIRTASALGQQAQRETKTRIDPIKAAQLVMRHLEQQDRAGDRDARRVNEHAKQIAATLEPASQLRFLTSYGKAISDYVLETGREPNVDESKMLLSDFAQRGGFQTRLPNLQIDAFGNPKSVNPYGGGGGGAPPPAAGGGSWGADVIRQGTAETGIPSKAPPVQPVPGASAPPPGGPAPVLDPRTPGAADRARYAGTAQAQAVPSPAPALGNDVTQTDKSRENVKQYERQRFAGVFKAQANNLMSIIEASGPTSVGITADMARALGGILDQFQQVIPTLDQGERRALAYAHQKYAQSGLWDRIVGQGENAARVKAGLVSLAASYSKSLDPQGRVTEGDMDRALGSLGGWFSTPGQVRRVLIGWMNDVDMAAGMPAAPEATGGGLAPKKQPVAGDVDVGSDGRAYQFRGGDPADPKSWAPL